MCCLQCLSLNLDFATLQPCRQSQRKTRDLIYERARNIHKMIERCVKSGTRRWPDPKHSKLLFAKASLRVATSSHHLLKNVWPVPRPLLFCQEDQNLIYDSVGNSHFLSTASGGYLLTLEQLIMQQLTCHNTNFCTLFVFIPSQEPLTQTLFSLSWWERCRGKVENDWPLVLSRLYSIRNNGK